MPCAIIWSSTVPVRSSLHSKCGTNIQLTDNGTIACRLRSYKDGVVFSAYPLQVEEMFMVWFCMGGTYWERGWGC